MGDGDADCVADCVTVPDGVLVRVIDREGVGVGDGRVCDGVGDIDGEDPKEREEVGDCEGI